MSGGITPAKELSFAERLADAARPIALKHFRTGVLADAKPAADFDPVTAADRGVEAAIRALIGEAYPDDGVVGEEDVERPSRSGRAWVIDPIDGTRAFIAGLPSWMVLIALADTAGPMVSVMDQPFTGERFSGVRGETAWLEHHGERRVISANRSIERLDQAILSTTDPDLFTGDEAEVFKGLAGSARVRRYGLDAYGYAALALGGIDLVVESGLKPWDVSALIPVVTGAGGVITDWRGGPCHHGGQVVAAANPVLHAAALKALAPAAI
jgi:histidinol phosphatase-like enzyme (inositol monophosphatase family)